MSGSAVLELAVLRFWGFFGFSAVKVPLEIDG